MRRPVRVEGVEPVEPLPVSAHACVYGLITGKPSTPSTPSTPAAVSSPSTSQKTGRGCPGMPIVDYEPPAARSAAESVETSEATQPDRSALGRRSRRKGKTWEREVAVLLRAVFGEHVKRGFQSRSGRDGCDVEGSPSWLEAKHAQLVDIRAAVRQALRDTDGRAVLVVCKDDRKPPGWLPTRPSAPPLAVMRLADWLELAKRAYGRQGPAMPDANSESPEAAGRGRKLRGRT